MSFPAIDAALLLCCISLFCIAKDAPSSLGLPKYKVARKPKEKDDSMKEAPKAKAAKHKAPNKNQNQNKDKDKAQRVDELLREIEVQAPTQYQIMQRLRELVFAIYPSATEHVMYGGVMFSVADEDFGGIFSYSEHVSFEFGRGFALSDPDGLLEGKGKMRRHLKLKSVEDIEQKQVEFYLKQVTKL